MVQFSVTFPAELGDVGTVGVYLIVQMRLDIMLSVAVNAVGCVGFFLKKGLTMPAFKIVFGNLGMAVRTVHLLGSLTGPLNARCHIYVALHAGSVLVDGILDHVFIHGQRDRLPVDNLMDVFLFMTFQTLTVSRPHYDRGPSNGMRLMADGAGRHGAGFRFPELSLDDLDMHLFDAGVTGHAGVSDVPGRDRGARVGMGQDQVIAVTVVAGGCDDQALPEQALAVNALGVVGEDVVFGDVLDTWHRGALPVAFPAQHRDIHLVCAGVDI
jgi:hypothetical protein